jgi:glycerol-3-phosphate acyltransferase PlsX
MAMSKFCLRTMATIERPAIAGIWPTMRGESIVLDVGATIGADAHQLIDFAMMGTRDGARAVRASTSRRSACSMSASRRSRARKRSRPPGSSLREAELDSMTTTALSRATISASGTVDVVVTEGFAGNIALKTAEGTAADGGYLRAAMTRT